MKTIKGISTAALVILISVSVSFSLGYSAITNPDPIVKVSYGEKAKTVELRMANLLGKKSSVIIMDESGTTVFSVHIKKKDGYAKCLDLSSLNEGNYTMIISRENKKVLHPLFLSDVGVEIIALNFENADDFSNDLVRYSEH